MAVDATREHCTEDEAPCREELPEIERLTRRVAPVGTPAARG